MDWIVIILVKLIAIGAVWFFGTGLVQEAGWLFSYGLPPVTVANYVVPPDNISTEPLTITVKMPTVLFAQQLLTVTYAISSWNRSNDTVELGLRSASSLGSFGTPITFTQGSKTEVKRLITFVANTGTERSYNEVAAMVRTTSGQNIAGPSLYVLLVGPDYWLGTVVRTVLLAVVTIALLVLALHVVVLVW